MSWTKFSTLLFAVYAFYYAVLLFWDLLHQKTTSLKASNNQEVRFSEDFETTLVSDEYETSSNIFSIKDEENDSQATIWERREDDTEEIPMVVPNVNVSTGGIKNISDLYRLAREETIVVKRQIAF